VKRVPARAKKETRPHQGPRGLPRKAAKVKCLTTVRTALGSYEQEHTEKTEKNKFRRKCGVFGKGLHRGANRYQNLKSLNARRGAESAEKTVFPFSLHGDLSASPPVLTTETLRHSVAGRDQISPRKTEENEEPQSDTDQHRSGSFLWLGPSVFICGLPSCLAGKKQSPRNAFTQKESEDGKAKAWTDNMRLAVLAPCGVAAPWGA
jgi:hypothetical protein